MPLTNVQCITQTNILMDKFLKGTLNQYLVVASRLYEDKKGILPNGYTYTLLVKHDDLDYGVDKQGNPRDSNQYQTFDVTVLSREHKAKKGDTVKLLDFDAEHSYVIGFDLLLRFKDIEVLPTQVAKPHA